ncbi:MAG: hypothetical protein WKF75_14040 [Singulisphaera sp.]
MRDQAPASRATKAACPSVASPPSSAATSAGPSSARSATGSSQSPGRPRSDTAHRDRRHAHQPIVPADVPEHVAGSSVTTGIPDGPLIVGELGSQSTPRGGGHLDHQLRRR